MSEIRFLVLLLNLVVEFVVDTLCSTHLPSSELRCRESQLWLLTAVIQSDPSTKGPVLTTHPLHDGASSQQLADARIHNSAPWISLWPSKGHPSSRELPIGSAEVSVAPALWISFSVCPIPSSSLPHRCIPRMHSSIYLLQTVLYLRGIQHKDNHRQNCIALWAGIVADILNTLNAFL